MSSNTRDRKTREEGGRERVDGQREDDRRRGRGKEGRRKMVCVLSMAASACWAGLIVEMQT